MFSPTPGKITAFKNGDIISGGRTVTNELYVDGATGRILDGFEFPEGERVVEDRTVDLKGRILCPGFIDMQFNGAFNVDLSRLPSNGDINSFKNDIRVMNQRLVRTGVTSYLATMTSQKPEVYQKILPIIGATNPERDPNMGSQSLGAHCEGPFLNIDKSGCHDVDAVKGVGGDCSLERLVSCYGGLNLGFADHQTTQSAVNTPVKMITIAPELPGALDTIHHLTKKGIVASIGHTKANYEESIAAVQAGARSITHLFNTMCPFHHREPGPLGTIAFSSTKANTARIEPDKRPYFGIIADGIHVHPASVNLAWRCHPQGLILVTDASMIAGCEDGVYKWTGGRNIEKRGAKVTLEGTDTIAGSAVTLMDCVNNFINFTGASVTEAISAVTSTPAALLGISDRKGNVIPGADADLLVLKREDSIGGTKLIVEQVWKFGNKVFDIAEDSNSLAAIKSRV
ncbi:CAZyme family CE9 [Paecilomyces variotii]|nr:CAZyme family CE9 [Paecilomyces variotii]KAJ9387249.1 CAZyme family CE9 [Paecilomyces variotii]